MLSFMLLVDGSTEYKRSGSCNVRSTHIATCIIVVCFMTTECFLVYSGVFVQVQYSTIQFWRRRKRNSDLFYRHSLAL